MSEGEASLGPIDTRGVRYPGMSSDSVLGFECAGLRMRPARLLHHLSNLLGHDLGHPQGRVKDFIYSVCLLIEEKQPPMVRCGKAH